MSEECWSAPTQTADRGLGDDRLQQGSGELQQQTPSAWGGQAASAQRGESSNSRMSGSSSRMIKR